MVKAIPRACWVAVAVLWLALAGGALAAPPGGPAYHGAQVHPWFPGRSEADDLRELDALRETGANTLRMDLPWTSVEPARKGARDEAFLRRVDAFIAAAVIRGMKPILNVHSSPCWASSAPEAVRRGCEDSEFGDFNWYAPTRPRDLEAIVRFLAARYEGSLSAVEIWNEPDESGGFFLRPRDLTLDERAKRYAPMLKAGYRGVKAAAPELRVLGGSVDGADTEFLQLLFDNGVKGYYDAISFHPYNGARGPHEAGPDPDYEFDAGTLRMRATMVRNGDTRPKLWMTEYGWTTCAEDPGQDPTRCVDEADQAAYARQALELARSRSSFVEGVSWYEIRDSRNEPPGCYECRFGLLRQNFSQRPSFEAFRAATLASRGRVMAPFGLTTLP